MSAPPAGGCAAEGLVARLGDGARGSHPATLAASNSTATNPSGRRRTT